ncbi:MAG: carbohydrate ABC transporter permease [Chloroflexota bacterium]|nr:carbohydrate ABC transporter permease [Chloroflexota bacterium]
MTNITLKPHAIFGLTSGQLLIRLALLVIFALCAYPFFYILSLAVMPYENFISSPVHFGPNGFTLEYFQQIFGSANLQRAFTISVFKTIMGTGLSVVTTVMAGWALSRPGLKYGRLLSALFIVPLYVGGGLIPYFLVIRATGMLNTFWALIIPSMVWPFNFLIARAYFANFPQEIVEAAKVDGASNLMIFKDIVWPTSTPIIATLAVLYGVGHWNDYFWPSFLVQPDLYPITVVLQNLISGNVMASRLGVSGFQSVSPQSFIAAVAAVLIIPVLVAYPLFQRYVVKGILVGSLKG